jgi:CubicO group peptidase (beta-lactamase class C family)
MPAGAATYMADVSAAPTNEKDTPATGSKLKEIDFQWSDDPDERKKTPTFVDTKNVKPIFNSGGGGLCGTMQDYCRFCEMLLHGGRSPSTGNRIISSRTIQFMTMNHLTKDGIETDFGGMSIPGYTEATASDGVGFGLGFSVVVNNALSKQIESKGTYSWGGAASTSFIIDPKENMFTVHMTALRFRDDRKLPLKMQLLQHVYGSIDDNVHKIYMSKL